MNLLSDKISNEKQDILGRRKFASEISKALHIYLKKNTDCITISITGEWGSGKSTLLQFLRNESLFFQMLSEMKDEYKLKFDESTIKSLWGYHGLAEYFTNMRDFKRFFNSLSFRLLL